MFNFEIKHRKGKDHVLPDALSRALPINIINHNGFNTSDGWYTGMFAKCKNNPSSTPDYIIKNNKLYRYSRSNTPFNSEFTWKCVVPLEFRDSIIAQNHCTPTTAHFGTYKTYHRIKHLYFWPGMYRDVATFISNCEICLAYQNQLSIGLMGKPKHCSRPFQCLSMDLIGPLPETKKLSIYFGNNLLFLKILPSIP